jgi:hypothetical protein
MERLEEISIKYRKQGFWIWMDIDMVLRGNLCCISSGHIWMEDGFLFMKCFKIGLHDTQYLTLDR